VIKMADQDKDQTQATPTSSKSQIVAIVSAALVASAPGFYSAWQQTKVDFQARRANIQASQAKQRLKVEQQVRDKQERDLQKYVKALEADIKEVKKSCVSHKDMIDLILKLQRPKQSNHRYTRERWHRARASYLMRKVRALRMKVKAAKAAKQNKKPALRDAKSFRKIIQQKHKPKSNK